LVAKYNTEFSHLIVHCVRWVTHFDLKVVESALTLLQLLIQKEDGQDKFLDAGGLAATINVIANLNLTVVPTNLAEAKKGKTEEDINILTLSAAL